MGAVPPLPPDLDTTDHDRRSGCCANERRNVVPVTGVLLDRPGGRASAGPVLPRVPRDGRERQRRSPAHARTEIVSTFEERRRARQSWPIRVFALGEEPLVDERDPSTADERLALVWTLTREQWLLAGLPFPEYSRAAMPGRVLRPT